VSRARSFAILGALASALLSVAASCGAPDTAARVDPIGPDRASFAPVADVLVRHCGTIDCHGTTRRNMRLYGYGGLRLPRADGGVILPDEGDTLPNEVQADYDAVIGVEPEKMRDVVMNHGAGADQLTFVRKARGTEDHKGLSPIAIGDDADTCIMSWLASATNTAACERDLPLKADAGP
jgi:hypothetical protein